MYHWASLLTALLLCVHSPHDMVLIINYAPFYIIILPAVVYV
jgi:hypothetical protein